MTGAYRVVVTVGTDHHPFDRLVGWVDRWAAAHPDLPVLVQRGESRPALHAASVEMLGYDELVAAMAGADAVVAQGGPGGIMDARSVGHRPIVVPRRGSLGEHVDDHQVAFTARMAELGLVWLAGDEAELVALLERALVDPAALRIPPDHGAVEATVDAFRAVVDPLVAGRVSRRRAGRRRS
ncbi:hypothetical protein BH10ACT1_BH10ACT1_33170 [soil metagenome]